MTTTTSYISSYISLVAVYKLVYFISFVGEAKNPEKQSSIASA